MFKFTILLLMAPIWSLALTSSEMENCLKQDIHAVENMDFKTNPKRTTSILATVVHNRASTLEAKQFAISDYYSLRKYNQLADEYMLGNKTEQEVNSKYQELLPHIGAYSLERITELETDFSLLKKIVSESRTCDQLMNRFTASQRSLKEIGTTNFNEVQFAQYKGRGLTDTLLLVRNYLIKKNLVKLAEKIDPIKHRALVIYLANSFTETPEQGEDPSIILNTEQISDDDASPDHLNEIVITKWKSEEIFWLQTNWNLATKQLFDEQK